jgi:hypothetical protein
MSTCADLAGNGANSSASRRSFLNYVSTVPGLAALGGAGLFSILQTPSAFGALGPLDTRQRRQRAFAIRRDAAIFQRDRASQTSIDNGDEQLYPNRIASFTKCLPHNQLGEVNLDAYNALISALASGRPQDFESIPLGGTVKFANPQASYCYSMVGADPAALASPPAPTFNSAETAGEMVEDYWAAITRDTPFGQYSTDRVIAQAAAELTKLSDFRGPKVKGAVTPEVIFRGSSPGELTGPYISQFLWKTVPLGAAQLPQLYRTTVPGDDYMTSYTSWLNVLNGVAAGSNVFDSTNRYIRNNRDLSEYLHRDFVGQANVFAAMLLLSFGSAALSPSNPYLHSATQNGSITFGAQNAIDTAWSAPVYALRSVWCQKWLVHRRVRPEVFGGRIHNHMTGAAKYSIHEDVLNSAALDMVFKARGNYLLPLPYPEGCPTHPSYPAAHAVSGAAGVTMLKAFFNESFVIPSPVVASDDGTTLLPYDGPPLTVGGELNKLAANVSIGRNPCGVHYRSDGVEGMRFGEEIALSVLRDLATTYNEQFSGFTLTRFDGTTINICPEC